jgi:hypothetical protein
MYIRHNTTRIVHTNASTPRISYIQSMTITINSSTIPGHYGTPVRDIECTCITHKQYCQMYARARRVPVNRNTLSCAITMESGWEGIAIVDETREEHKKMVWK